MALSKGGSFSLGPVSFVGFNVWLVSVLQGSGGSFGGVALFDSFNGGEGDLGVEFVLVRVSSGGASKIVYNGVFSSFDSSISFSFISLFCFSPSFPL